MGRSARGRECNTRSLRLTQPGAQRLNPNLLQLAGARLGGLLAIYHIMPLRICSALVLCDATATNSLVLHDARVALPFTPHFPRYTLLFHPFPTLPSSASVMASPVSLIVLALVSQLQFGQTAGATVPEKPCPLVHAHPLRVRPASKQTCVVISNFHFRGRAFLKVVS